MQGEDCGVYSSHTMSCVCVYITHTMIARQCRVRMLGLAIDAADIINVPSISMTNGATIEAPPIYIIQ